MSSNNNRTFGLLSKRGNHNYSQSGSRAPPSSYGQNNGNASHYLPSYAQAGMGMTSQTGNYQNGGSLATGVPSSVACTPNGTVMTMLPNRSPTQTQPSDWNVGQVIKIPHIVTSLDDKEKDSDLRVWTNRVGYICPKFRFAIIVAVYPTRMVVLPMYSAHNNGVMYKSDEYKLTAMSVWNPSQQVDPQVAALLTPEHLKVDGTKVFTAGSHVNLTEPMTVNYKSHIAAVDMLTEDSKALLLRRYRQAVQMAYVKPRADQTPWFKKQIKAEKEPSTTLGNAMKGLTLAGSTLARTSFSYAKVTSQGNA